MEKIIKFIKVNYKIIIMILITTIVVVSTGLYILNRNGVINFNSIKVNNQDSSINKNTNIDNTEIENSNIEKSDVSISGMRFKTTWTYLKSKIDNYNNGNIAISDWKVAKPYGNNLTVYRIIFRKFRNPTLAESAMGLKVVPYDAFDFEFIVENSSDKVDAISYSWLNTEDLSENAKVLLYYVSIIDDDLHTKIAEFFQQLLDARTEGKDLNDVNICSYYKNNIYIYGSGTNTTSSMIISPASEEEVKYHKQNKCWRLIKDLSKNDLNTKTNNTSSNNSNNTVISNNISSSNNKLNNISSSIKSNNTTQSYKTIDDVLNDTNYFAKYSLNLVNNAKTLSGAKNYEELQMKENWSDLKPRAFYYEDTYLDDTSIYSSRNSVVKDDTHPIYKAKFIYDYNGYCYVRKGVDLSKIKIEYDIEYKAKQKDSNNYDDFGFVFTPKLKVNGNKLTIELNANCITDRFYG